ncbi:MAG: family 1 glycosylhydrolase [Candidatus Jordarchaeales archaeon]
MGEFRDLVFPSGFLWGCAVAAHQVEGNNTNNNWWKWEQEGHTLDLSGIACDHYNRYEEDLDIAKKLSLNTFRTSVEWSRIEPKEGVWSDKEIKHYRRVLEAMRERGLTPMITLHHFTDPLWFAEKGGWEKPESIDIFARFVRKVVEELGDLIPFYNTINEPMVYVVLGYAFGVFPPGERDIIKALTVAKHLLLAHAKAYRVIHEACKEKGYPKPKVGVVHNMMVFEPLDPNDEKHVNEANTSDAIYNRWFLESIHAGAVQPPAGQGEEVEELKGAWDFIGLNYYTRNICISSPDPTRRFNVVPMDAELTDMHYEVYPEGLYKLLVSLKKYGKPVYITENGIATSNDRQRCRFILRHIAEAHRAMREGVDLKGYIYWSLIDNFEWNEGFSKRFGIVEVDYKTLKRTPRESAYMYAEIAGKNKVTSGLMQKYLGRK